MNIISVRHRGLRELLEEDSTRFLPSGLAARVRNVLTVLILAEEMEDFRSNAPPGWRVHQLSGQRRGQWSVSVSGNWRITFEEAEGNVEQLNLEDYH